MKKVVALLLLSVFVLPNLASAGLSEAEADAAVANSSCNGVSGSAIKIKLADGTYIVKCPKSDE